MVVLVGAMSVGATILAPAGVDRIGWQADARRPAVADASVDALPAHARRIRVAGLIPRQLSSRSMGSVRGWCGT